MSESLLMHINLPKKSPLHVLNFRSHFPQLGRLVVQPSKRGMTSWLALESSKMLGERQFRLEKLVLEWRKFLPSTKKLSPFVNTSFIVSDDDTHQIVESLARKDRAQATENTV
jgi:hypothetical protein